MQVEAQVLVPDGTPVEQSKVMAEFPLERQAPPGYVVDWERAALRRVEPLTEIGAERHTWEAVAVPLATTRYDAPVGDLPPERQAVNRARQSVHPLIEHRPLHY